MARDTITSVREHGRDGLVAKLDGLVADLREHGVQISSASRLVQYARALERIGKKATLTAEELKLASHSYSEGSELIEVTDHLRAQPEVPGWRQLFRRIQGGNVVPTASPDPARDAQLELLVGGALRAAGAEVVFDEPDARATWEGHSLAIAAKRVSSPNKLEKNVRKARNQIATAKMAGLIAVDFTMLMPDGDRLYEVPDAASAPAIVDPMLRAGIARAGGRITSWVQADPEAARNVLALVGVARGRFTFSGPDGRRFGTVRRLLAGEVVPQGVEVPSWVKEFVLRFNRIGAAPRARPS